MFHNLLSYIIFSCLFRYLDYFFQAVVIFLSYFYVNYFNKLDYHLWSDKLEIFFVHFLVNNLKLYFLIHFLSLIRIYSFIYFKYFILYMVILLCHFKVNYFSLYYNYYYHLFLSHLEKFFNYFDLNLFEF